MIRNMKAGMFALAATAAAVFAAPTPSMAAGDDYYTVCDSTWASCQTGAEVSYPAGVCDTAGSDYHYTRVCVDYYGDYVYVYDGKADGLSAMAYIDSDYGEVLARFCRNTHGYGSWAKCNFDWREDGYKWVSAGVRLGKYYFAFDYEYLWRFANN